MPTIACPQCKREISFTYEELTRGIHIICAGCDSKLKVNARGATQAPPPEPVFDPEEETVKGTPCHVHSISHLHRNNNRKRTSRNSATIKTATLG